MVFLLQGQSDPLIPGQRKANLKCQSPVDISEIRARCIYKAIGWFRIDSYNVTCSEQEVMIDSDVADPVGLEVTTGASAVLACSSCTSVRAFEVSVSRMTSVAS